LVFYFANVVRYNLNFVQIYKCTFKIQIPVTNTRYTEWPKSKPLSRTSFNRIKNRQ